MPVVHTICASSAFLAALIVGWKLHFHKIVTNAHYTYPDEWFPSVSATIGDRYPERSIFQILIALTSFPRFLLLLGHYMINESLLCFLVGLARTVSCGGWVYITSTDDHDTHDVFMIAYIILTLPWDILVIRKSEFKTGKIAAMTAFFGTIVPLIYWYVQHQVHKRAGAYSVYAYFEWSLIILDIAFDALAYHDFKKLSLNLELTSDIGNWFFMFKNKDSSKPAAASALKKTIDEEVRDISYAQECTQDSIDLDYAPPGEEDVDDNDSDSFADESMGLLQSDEAELKIMIQEEDDIIYLADNGSAIRVLRRILLLTFW